MAGETLPSMDEIADRLGFVAPDRSDRMAEKTSSSSGVYFLKGAPEEVNHYSLPGFSGRDSVFGVGHFAFSKINGFMTYSMNESLSDDPPSYDCFGTDQADRSEMVEYILFSLASKSAVDIADFNKVFDRDMESVFKESISRLSILHKGEIIDGRFLFHVRDLKERLVMALFFFEDSDIDGRIGNIRKEASE